MIYGSIAFAIFLLVVVAVKYLAPTPKGCPQCGQGRVDDHPLCTNCGWIFDVDDEDDDDGPHESESESELPWST
ncbi:MAG: hypothetical protein QGG05_17450 [Candidatus Latescibacteria bacterium]|nr:hypothetical protein [Candidatus Latescibacterota bacterium]MEE3042605.1 hypothetical protein [Candidatus Latescibacterota bacterium]